MENVYNGVYFTPTLLADVDKANEILARCDMTQKTERIYEFLKIESKKAGIRPEIFIFRSKTMETIRYSRVIYGLLMLNYGDIEEGIEFCRKFIYKDNLPIYIDKKNQKVIIHDEGTDREYDFSEVIFVEDFLPRHEDNSHNG